MPGTLLKYVKHPLLAHENRASPSSKEGDILAKILHLIQDATGLDFAYYKPSTVIRRIERRMGVNQIEKLEYYLRYLEKNPDEIQVLYSELLIGVTRFFRDKEAFHILLQKVIPEIVPAHQGHSAKASIRIWVAGCSSGKEVYSLAILLSEYLERHGTSAEIKIFAPDIDQRAVDIAAIGKYPASIVSDIPVALLSKYFFGSNDYYQVVEKIRKMVIFAPHNLLTDPPFNNLDLVTCRNLLIYLRNDIQQKVLSMFGFALKKDGFFIPWVQRNRRQSESSFCHV
jgi:two-component system CheB/CheR fusion protein